ncbi:MAG: HAMP domain-containing sensor histidine kinase [Pseudomonadota bacterium]
MIGTWRAVTALLLLWLGSIAIVLMLVAGLGAASLAETEEATEELLDGVLHEVALWQQAEAIDALQVATASALAQDFTTFRDAYLDTVTEALEAARSPSARAALLARRVLLGEDASLPTAPVGREGVLERMLQETPEQHHERLEALVFRHWDDVPGLDFDAAIDALTADDVHAWLLAAYDEEAYVEFCLALLAADGTPLLTTLERLPTELEDPDSLLRRVADDEDDEASRCLVRARSLAGGGRLFLGEEAPALHAQVEDFGGMAFLALLLLGPAILAFSWAGAVKNRRQLNAIEAACERAVAGDFSTRILVAGAAPLATLASTLNEVFEQTEGAMEGLRTLSANIAHDLRTPLTRLRGQIDLLIQTPQTDPAMISAVQAEADQLLDTFSALLRIAQVESGSPKKGFRPFDLRQLLIDAAELYAPTFEEQTIAFDVQVQDGARIIQGDLDLWMQCVANLLENAIKYGPPGAQVMLSLEDQDSGCLLRLRDTGPGIPDLELSRVLDRFYRLPKHRGERGNGLGLSLVAAVCKLHDAGLTLRNEGGLVVEIHWPQVEQRG